MMSDTVTTLLAEESVELEDGGQIQKQVFFTPPQPGKKFEVIIELPGKEQKIRYSGQSNFQ